MSSTPFIIGPEDPILVTGSAGFIGTRVVDGLIRSGFRRVRCFVRPAANLTRLESVMKSIPGEAKIEILRGNLLSPDDCARAVSGVKVVYHLAAGRGEKLVADAFLNSVVTT